MPACCRSKRRSAGSGRSVNCASASDALLRSLHAGEPSSETSGSGGIRTVARAGGASTSAKMARARAWRCSEHPLRDRQGRTRDRPRRHACWSHIPESEPRGRGGCCPMHREEPRGNPRARERRRPAAFERLASPDPVSTTDRWTRLPRIPPSDRVDQRGGELDSRLDDPVRQTRRSLRC